MPPSDGPRGGDDVRDGKPSGDRVKGGKPYYYDDPGAADTTRDERLATRVHTSEFLVREKIYRC